ncbi:BolA-like protein [Phytophthora citrophthora]|uniref:BolA-like protein n=1 Tax=Phytophthora citrophthora TaxID=4793 RepID=A0AAD9LSQ2_9STRA|nr:BolA-like protein [Phytophthora citrophthora]
MTDASPLSGPVARRIHEKLQEAFAPAHLDVINESHMHSVPKGSETHFKVVVVTEQFDGKPLIQRHRMVNAVLQQELDDGVHALSILSKTPKQWEANANVKPSPNCRGGMTVDETKKEFLEGLKKKHQSE